MYIPTMIPILTTAQMRAIDAETIAGNPAIGFAYMCKAGECIFKSATRMIAEKTHQSIAVFCGKGNNGGDGYVVARLLMQDGFQVACFGICPPEELAGEARMAYDEFVSIQGDVTCLHHAPDKSSLQQYALIIDALLGTGMHGDPRGIVAELITTINAANRPVLSVDTPSGLDNDSGAAGTPTIRATRTVSLGFPKIGQLMYPARDYLGLLTIHNLGYPDEIVMRLSMNAFLPTRGALAALVPMRKPTGSKFDHGLALLVCGSAGMAGSAALAAQAALRCGCGMVHLATPAALADTLAAKLLEPVIYPMPETAQGSLAAPAEAPILAMAEKMQAALIGPGLTHHAETSALIRTLVATLRTPCVLDADGINAFKGCTEQLKNRTCPLILTPHAGEWKRLFRELPVEPSLKIIRLAAIAREYNLAIVYKGNPTIVAVADGRTFVVPLGNSGMATAGSGDVLGGIIVSLIAQGCTTADAALLGAALHGLTGEAAARTRGEHGMIASDLTEHLPEVIKSLAPVVRNSIVPD
jgi:hydroxyethylthiazole kinase-like uncharacterized protein yjeF